MKKEVNNEFDNELLDEYDFSQMDDGIRGKYAERYQQDSNLVLLDPDVAKAFPTDKAVNEALRLLLKLAKSQLQNPE